MPEPDEPGLVQRAQQDPKAFDVLYERYVEQIFAFAYRQTGDRRFAEDITSAAFEKALRGLPDYRWQGKSFGAWLYRIALNEIHRSRWRQRLFQPFARRGEEEFSAIGAFAASPEDSLQANEQQRALWAAVARLPERDREVLSLRYFEGLSSAETAEALGCSPDNVYLRLHRALERLRRLLDEPDPAWTAPVDSGEPYVTK